MTVRWLSVAQADLRLIICTGERMESLMPKIYQNTETTNFRPKHAGDRLSNDFRCYANFEDKVWQWEVESSVS